MTKSRFQIAKSDIREYFDNSPNHIYADKDISTILRTQRRFWRLPRSLTTSEFINLLVKYTNLHVHDIHFPNMTITRFSWGEVPIYQLATNIKERAYLSHYSALLLNDLTEQIPKKIYVTYEQPEKSARSSEISQIDIDNAFSKPTRVSKNIAEFKDYSICLLNGQYTGRLGVKEIDTKEYGSLSITNIERSLIDIVVRPVYSGGIYEVLNAFKKAKSKVSINKLSAMLKKLEFVYPYHQAIGFYMEKSGVYNENQINLLANFEKKYKFYLTREMQETEFSDKWNLYYPKGF